MLLSFTTVMIIHMMNDMINREQLVNIELFNHRACCNVQGFEFIANVPIEPSSPAKALVLEIRSSSSVIAE